MDNIRRVEYCRWFREDIANVIFLPVERGFIYRVMSTAKTAAFGQPLISPTFFIDPINTEGYYKEIIYPYIGHLNEGEIARGYFR
jgi:hypothetical protein